MVFFLIKMAEQLKLFFGEKVITAIASDLRRVLPAFQERPFIDACLAGLESLELTGRAWRIAEAMHAHLPRPFGAAAEALVSSLGPELPHTDSFGMAPFHYLPHVFYVQKHGLDDFEASMRAQYELTKRFSAESSIRAFLVKHPEATYKRLVEWAKDPSVHVRRLVSEGTRPRLPWAPRLRAFQEDSRPVLALLEMLKDDPARYVQRSVANNLNDIGKDHPDLAVDTCRRWLKEATPARKWIVSHALRSLVKKGHRGALSVMGVGAPPRVKIGGAVFSPRSIRIGGQVRFSFVLKSMGTRAQSLAVDYAVHFVKANGECRPKVFKLKRLALGPGESVALGGKISFAHMTTRKPYAGSHQIDVMVNGIPHPLGKFEVRA